MKSKRFLLVLLVICVWIQPMTAFSSEKTSEAVQTEIIGETAVMPASIGDNSVLVTELETILLIRNKQNAGVIQDQSYSAKQQELDYSESAQLFRFIPYAGNTAMGLPSGTFLIESISHPSNYLTAGSSCTFQSYGSFPLGTMLWFIYINNDGTYTFVPASNTDQALCAPMISTMGYSPYVTGYNSNNNFMKWHLNPNYSWYSQKSPWNGWETGIYDYAVEGAIALDDLTFEGGEYAGRSLTYAISAEGCHLSSIAMILANMDVYTNSQKYDVRFGADKYIFADPYAAAMANLNLTDWSIAADGVLEGNLSNPMNAVYDYIKNTFNVLVQEEENIGSTAREKAQYISNMLAQHDGGVILRFSTHSIVAVSSSYTFTTADEDLDDSFMVFDPGKSLSSEGCYLTLNDNGRSLDDVESIYYITHVTETE